MNSINLPMRGLYKRGEIYWIAYKALSQIVRESTGTSDLRLAEAILSKRRTEVFERRWIGRLRDTRTPIPKAVQEFLTVYSKPRKMSWQEDRLILGRFSAYVGPNACLQDIDRRLIERFQLQLLADGVSKPRVNRHVAALKCFFNRFIDWGTLQTNPCRGIRLYPEVSRTHWLEAGQIANLLSHCSTRLKPIVEVALLTGLRKGDILRLTWERIDSEQGLIRIVQGKTQTPLLLPISRALAEVLHTIPRDMYCPYVFQDRGRPLRKNGWVRTDFTRAVKAAELASTHFHDLRHTAATQLRRLGRDLQIVQQLLGHKSIRTTMRYSHVHPTELRDAVNSLGEKIIPRGLGRFTITSQSSVEGLSSNPAPVRNDARFQSEENSGISETGEMRETVKHEHPPTTEQKLTDPPSST